MVLSLPGAPGVQAALLPVFVGVLAFGVLHLLRRSPVLAAVVVVHPVLVVAILGRLGTGVLAADLMATLGWAIIVGTAGLFTLARLVQSGLGPILGWRPENRDLLALIALGLVLSGLAVETGLGLSRD